jgi:hypothetical protein
MVRLGIYDKPKLGVGVVHSVGLEAGVEGRRNSDLRKAIEKNLSDFSTGTKNQEIQIPCLL